MIITIAIIAFICVCFGISQHSQGYDTGSGFISIICGILIALQGCFQVDVFALI